MAIRLIEAEKFGHMVALEPPDVKAVPFEHIRGEVADKFR
jgi:hypothetical protein